MQNINFTAHQDNATGDWVITVAENGNRIAIASANGQAEADLIVASLNTVCCRYEESDPLIQSLWLEYVGFIDT